MAATKLDLNSADLDSLVRQLYLSPRLARRIVALRPFASMADLEKVWGMDARTYARLVERAMVSPAPASPEATPEAPARPEPPVAIESLPPAAGESPLSSLGGPAELPPPDAPPAPPPARLAPKFAWALAVIVLCGAYLRFVGQNWDAGQHQHPDERFVTMVAEQSAPSVCSSTSSSIPKIRR
jgi:hypothetical protein